MLRFLLTPRWLALHVATIAAIAGTLLLGSWQMRAYAEQEERDRVAAANLAEDAPTAPIDEVAPAGQGLDGRRGQPTGHRVGALRPARDPAAART